MSKYRIWFFFEETHHAYVDFEAENAKEAERIFVREYQQGVIKVEEIPEIVQTWYTFDCVCTGTGAHMIHLTIAHSEAEARKWIELIFPGWKCKLVHVGA